jgi:hypothetical protein
MRSYQAFFVNLLFGNWLNKIVLFLAVYAFFSTSLQVLRLVTLWTSPSLFGVSVGVATASAVLISLKFSKISWFVLAVSRQVEKISIWNIVALGLGFRLLWVFSFPAQPGSDGGVYLKLAEVLKNGGVYEIAGTRAYWPVGYPLFLSAWLHLVEDRQIAYLLSNLFVYLFAISGVIKLTNNLTRGGGGKLAAFLFALWPNLIFNTATPEKEMLILALLPWGTFFIIKACVSAQYRSTFIAGLLLGFSTLVQPSLQFLPLVFSILLLVVLGFSRSSFIKVLFLCGGAALVIAPWTVRNYQQFDHFVLVSTNGGDNFYRANNSLATGGYTPKGEIDLDDMDEINRNNIAKELAIDWIVSHPINFITLSFEKQIRFMGDDAGGVYGTLKVGKASNNTKIYAFFKGFANLWWMMMWMVLASLVLDSQRERKTIPAFAFVPFWLWLYLFVMHSVFESAGKYHMPVLWVLCVLTACYHSANKTDEKQNETVFMFEGTSKNATPSGGIGIYTTFQCNKNNGLQKRQTPSPDGEGWGEENKINYLYSPHPRLLPQGLNYAHCI